MQRWSEIILNRRHQNINQSDTWETPLLFFGVIKTSPVIFCTSGGCYRNVPPGSATCSCYRDNASRDVSCRWRHGRSVTLCRGAKPSVRHVFDCGRCKCSKINPLCKACTATAEYLHRECAQTNSRESFCNCWGVITWRLINDLIRSHLRGGGLRIIYTLCAIGGGDIHIHTGCMITEYCK